MIRVDAGSVRLVAQGLHGAIGQKEQAATVAAMGHVLHGEVEAAVSLRDHSLRQLARLGHPYARRHGAIQVGKLGHAAHLVHIQSGRLHRALHHGAGEALGGVGGAASTYRVWLDPTQAPHARYVVEGTRTMLPRDTLWTVAAEPQTRRAMMRAAVLTLGARLRTKAAVRFGRTGPGPAPRMGV